MAKNVNYFNKVEVIGEVTSMNIRETKTGMKIGTLFVKDNSTGSITFITAFNRDVYRFGDVEVKGLDGLKGLFINKDGTPKGKVVKVNARASETVSKDSYGNSKVYQNYTLNRIDPCDDEDNKAILLASGLIQQLKVAEDGDGNPYAKLKIAIVNRNKDNETRGVDYVSVIARNEDLVEKLEDANNGDFIVACCDILNTLGEKDKYGYSVGAPVKEIRLEKIRAINDDVDEDELELFKLAKKLQRGEFINADGEVVSTNGNATATKPSKPKKTAKVDLDDDDDDDDIDF